MFYQETKQSNSVLGKTFKSENERRQYFRNELRKKLPELKKMEGFPIGEDEDIINLSDPPYYTACPNPWLNDFVAEWEEEKKELEKQGKRKKIFEVRQPYATDISEGKNNHIYNAHSYYTKVPHKVIMKYILHYTNPGDVIFDGFGGTGMTGVAAQMCGTKNLQIKNSINSEFAAIFNKTPEWGIRRAICSDLSPIASFLSSCFNTDYCGESFDKDVASLIKNYTQNVEWLYKTNYKGKSCTINYMIISDIYSCKGCQKEFLSWDVFMDLESGMPKPSPKCEYCDIALNDKNIDQVYHTVYDKVLGDTIRTRKREIALINFIYNKKSINKKPDVEDKKFLVEINNFEIPFYFPTDRTPFGSEGRRNDKFGITHFHQFYSKRNLIASSYLYNQTKDNKHFRFGFFNTTWHSTLMRRYNGGGGHRPKTGTFYMPGNSSDGNTLKIYTKKLRQLKSFFSEVSGFDKNNSINGCGSATQTTIKDNSIDYIFTDPPFGGNIMYSELNSLWEAWLKVYTNESTEAIESSKKGKDILIYQSLMIKAFTEYYRILKPGKWMTVEFSNPSAVVWNTIQNSISYAGFIIANVSALDKKQKSISSYTTPTAVNQDLIISCYKPTEEFTLNFQKEINQNFALWDFINEHLKHLPIHLIKGNATTAIIERNSKILFDRLIAFYVQRGLPVPIDAGKFKKGLRERFVERDDMFFTLEQVQEYDRKKAEMPEFVQLSILVSSEQDGVLWMKNYLKDNPSNYQDIRPDWMKALGGVRKGDIIPEMETILEENFLKDEKGHWYLPDPENEVDLEKMRNKRLLRQFEIYKQEASKPRGKVKEARVEALRAGFKQCYQDKDFKTIVQLGDRTPNNLLMEDEVLLQFYDIASTRV